MKKCLYCAEEIQDEAIICRFCGNHLESETVQTAISKKGSKKTIYLFPLLIIPLALLYMESMRIWPGIDDMILASVLFDIRFPNIISKIITFWVALFYDSPIIYTLSKLFLLIGTTIIFIWKEHFIIEFLFYISTFVLFMGGLSGWVTITQLKNASHLTSPYIIIMGLSLIFLFLINLKTDRIKLY